MREVNSSSPHKNQAATVITHALYDRRALDCTSTLPLCISLSNLVYLTTSSAKIRQILTQDGGLERLVVMLKKGKCKTKLESMKWYYALQCVVNIGVRGSDLKAQDPNGSEQIRTRVVEADIVPVIATLLDNYLAGLDKLKASYEPDLQTRRRHRHRPPPPPIDPNQPAPPPPIRSAEPAPRQNDEDRMRDDTPEVMSSPPDRTTFPMHVQGGQTQEESQDLQALGLNTTSQYGGTSLQRHSRQRHHHHHHPHHHHHHHNSEPNNSRRTSTATPHFRRLHQDSPTSADLAPPPMTAGLRHEDGNSSQPDTPTPATPTRALSLRRTSETRRRSAPHPQPRAEEPSSAESDEEQTGQRTSVNNSRESVVDVEMGPTPEPQVDGMNNADMVEASQGILDPEDANSEYSDTFNIRHRSLDGRLIDPTTEPLNPAIPGNTAGSVTGDNTNGFTTFHDLLPRVQDAVQDPVSPDGTNDAPSGTTQQPESITWMPHMEHVLLSLQLLAYVSKYCHLRSYFLQTHLVPALRPAELRNKLDLDTPSVEEDDDNEYLLPQTFNIFPLIEKFTVKAYSDDMKYWACVIMRNLCRKDKAHGDVRQCAHYKCGRWETYARQFAKCRRCRQTKYCSKVCQKEAWVFHRHWCEPAKEKEERVERDGQRRASGLVPQSSSRLAQREEGMMREG